jgi:hypothetical protein
MIIKNSHPMKRGTGWHKGLRKPQVAKHPKRTYYDKGLSPSNAENKLNTLKNSTESRVEAQKDAKFLTH